MEYYSALEPEAWVHGTDWQRGEAGGVDWMKEGEENTKKHIYT